MFKNFLVNDVTRFHWIGNICFMSNTPGLKHSLPQVKFSWLIFPENITMIHNKRTWRVGCGRSAFVTWVQQKNLEQWKGLELVLQWWRVWVRRKHHTYSGFRSCSKSREIFPKVQSNRNHHCRVFPTFKQIHINTDKTFRFNRVKTVINKTNQ